MSGRKLEKVEQHRMKRENDCTAFFFRFFHHFLLDLFSFRFALRSFCNFYANWNRVSIWKCVSTKKRNRRRQTKWKTKKKKFAMRKMKEKNTFPQSALMLILFSKAFSRIWIAHDRKISFASLVHLAVSTLGPFKSNRTAAYYLFVRSINHHLSRAKNLDSNTQSNAC